MFLFDADWKLLTSYPEGQHPGLTDVQLADLDGDGQLKMEVSYWGPVGVQTASFAGKRLASNRTLENVIHLIVVGPDAAGHSRLLCSNGDGSLVWLDDKLERTGQIALPQQQFHTMAVDFSAGEVQQICALSSVEVGKTSAVGIDRDGHEIWNYELPAGIYEQPVEPLTRSPIVAGEDGKWLIVGADGSLHFLGRDGKLADTFNYGEPLHGVAAAQFDGQPGLIIATAAGVTAWRIDP